MKQANLFTASLCIISFAFFLSSCTKQITSNSFEGETQEAIREIKKIIGDEGIIKLVGENSKNTSDNQVESSTINNNKIRKLSIDEFRKVYKAFKTKQVSFKVIEEGRVDSVIKQKEIKSNSYILIGDDTYDDYDGSKDNGNGNPLPAGLYFTTFKSELLQFYIKGYIDGNAPLFFSNLTVQYRTDGSGRITNTPLIYLTGLSIYTWTQNSSHLVSFNSSSYKSVFDITGTTNCNISFGPLVFNVSSAARFRVTMDMDDTTGRIVKIELLETENLTM